MGLRGEYKKSTVTSKAILRHNVSGETYDPVIKKHTSAAVFGVISYSSAEWHNAQVNLHQIPKQKKNYKIKELFLMKNTRCKIFISYFLIDRSVLCCGQKIIKNWFLVMGLL